MSAQVNDFSEGISAPSLATRAYEAIRDMIVTLEIRPGAAISEDALCAALAQLLAAVSEETPVLVLLDDAHAADDASWRLLAALTPVLTGRVAMVLFVDEARSEARAALRAVLAAACAVRVRLQPLDVAGVDAMLDRLHGRFPMAVVSARDARSTMRFLDQFDLAKYFDVIVTGLSAPHTKPYPDPILLAAQKMAVHPAQCLMIGDTTVDIRAGKAAGAQAVGVLCGFGEEPELRQLGADLILPSTSNLTEVFNGKHD